MGAVEKIKDLYCEWCPKEQECDEHLTLEEKRGCVACGGFADELLNLGYLQVEPIQLEVLGEDEITNLYQRLAFNIKALVLKKLQDNVRWVISNNFGTELSQATIIHNEKRGQLYRLKEPLWGNKKEKI